MGDLLAGAGWECCSTRPGAASDPAGLDRLSPEWMGARVPGTAAAAMARAGLPEAHRGGMDERDWWFRCRFRGEEGGGGWLLAVGGVATVSDVWLNGRHVGHGESMFVPYEARVEELAADSILVVRCAALAPLLAARRPRPRWKSYLVDDQNLRWHRTSLLGRLPGWAVVPSAVGPWRPLTLTALPPLRLASRRVVATCLPDGETGLVRLTLSLSLGSLPRLGDHAVVRVGEVQGRVPVRLDDGSAVLEGAVTVPEVRRWWPHTHGEQPLYPVSVELGGQRLELGRVGFRTIEVDRGGGGFSVSVNGVPVFCRGACWLPPDPVSLGPDPAEVRDTLELARDAGMNMLRLPGTSVYEDDCFWDLCDERGMLVWQDCMLAFMDYPTEDAFVAELTAELRHVLGRLGGRPSLAVVCGGQEMEEVAAMVGLARDRWSFPIVEKVVPALVDELLPGAAYVTSN
ncbi:MAG: glycosyl hydrolase 2 galactose-binding domain-containing protein, partial [Acidimicrobiales bacterium]